MRDWFDHRGISFKLGLGIIGGIAFLSVLGVGLRLHLFGTASAQNHLLEIANRIEVLLLDGQRSEKDFMLRDLSDPAFYETGETISLSRHKATLVELRKEIIELASALPDDSKRVASDLLRLSDQYAENFYKLVAAYRERGDKEAVLASTWQALTADIEDATNGRASASVLDSLLTLKRDETDYIVGHQESTIDAVNSDIDKLKKVVFQYGGFEGSKLSDDAKKYESAFKSHVIVNRKIGLTESMGFQADMHDPLHAMVPLVSKLQEDASLEGKNATRDLNAMFYLSLVAILGIAGGTGYLVYTKKASTTKAVKSASASPPLTFTTPLAHVDIETKEKPAAPVSEPSLFSVNTVLESGNGSEMPVALAEQIS